MSLQVACACGTVLNVPLTAAGKTGRCGSCGRRIAVPTAEEIARREARELDPRYVERLHDVVRVSGTESPRGFWADAACGFLLGARAINVLPLVFVWFVHLLMVLLSYGGCYGLIGNFFVAGWLCAFCMNVIRETASGEDEIPTLRIEDGLWEDIVVPFVEFVASGLAVFAPAIICLIFDAVTDVAALTYVTRGLLVVGLLAWPAALLMVALGGWTAPFQLDMLVLTIVRSFWAYLAVLLLLAATIALGSVVINRVTAPAGTGSALFGARFGRIAAAQLAQSYALMVSMRCVGLYYRHFKDRFPWSAG